MFSLRMIKAIHLGGFDDFDLLILPWAPKLLPLDSTSQGHGRPLCQKHLSD